MWDALSGTFGKRLNSGAQWKWLLNIQELLIVLDFEKCVGFSVTYSFSSLLIWGEKVLRYLTWANPSSGTNVDTSPALFFSALSKPFF